MSLFGAQKNPGSPIEWSVGRRGEKADIHPGIVMDLVTIAEEYNGRVVQTQCALIAVQVTARPEQGGHKYITLARKGQPIPLAFLWPRERATADGESLLIPGLDDLTLREVQQNLRKANEAMLEAATPVAAAAVGEDELADL